MHASSRRAFTLIELLVVIAIIAILAAILFPVFAQAKASAKNTQDLSNIRQISTAQLIYMNDADDMFVPTGSWNDPSITPKTNPSGPAAGVPWNGWGLKLSSFVKNQDLFRSPFFAKTGAFNGSCASSAGMAMTNNYSQNWFLGADGSYGSAGDGDYGSTPNGTRLATPMTQTAVNQPANTISFLLSNSVPPYGTSWGCDYVTLEASDFINKIRFRAIHNNGGNLAFVDGHAKFYPAKEADSAGSTYPKCNGNPSHTIYNWSTRNMWMYPGMPNDNGGYGDGPSVRGCAQ